MVIACILDDICAYMTINPVHLLNSHNVNHTTLGLLLKHTLDVYCGIRQVFDLM